MISNMAACGKFKSPNLFRLLLLLNVTFPLASTICNLGITWSNLTSTRPNAEVPFNTSFGPALETDENADRAVRKNCRI